MKKILVILICLLALPLTVNGMAYSETFNVGDRIKVLIDPADAGGKEFFVIKTSGENETYVWAIMNGIVGGPTIYDEEMPGTHEASGILEETGENIQKVLTLGTTNWRSKTTRLPIIEDFTGAGITLGSGGKYEIKSNRWFMAPIVINEVVAAVGYKGINYWTQSCVGECRGATVEMYAAIYNEAFSGDSLQTVATLEPQNISVITGAPEYVVRPVIEIDKQYIDCKLDDNGNKVTTPPSNPQTSEVLFPVQFLAVIAVASIIYVVVRKKEVFTKI